MPRVRLFSLLPFLIFAAFCSAQSNSPDEPRFNVTGTVVNALTGEPIKRALVEVYAQQPRAIMTDGDGRFQFDAVPRGSYSIQARKPGFFSESEITRGRHNNPVLLNDGTQSVTIKLYPEAIISGIILDRDGLPVPQMMVRVLSRQIEAGRARWVAVQQKSTDEDGAYRIPGLMPGAYAIAAGPYSFPAPLLENGKGRPEGFRETFYPSGYDLPSAQKFQVNSGQKLEANFNLTPEPLYKVHGTYSGDALSVSVSLMAASLGISGSNISTRMLEGNQFESEWTPPGNYRLVANGNDSTGHAVAANVPLIVHQDVLNAHIALQPLISIPIEVEQQKVATKKNSSEVTFSRGMRDRAQIGYLQIRAKEPWMNGSILSASILPDSVLPTVAPGRYDVQLTMNPPWYAAAVTRGDADLFTQELVVAPGGEQQPIHIVARDDSANIKIHLEAPPNTTATLLIVPSGRGPGQIREIQIAAGGETYLQPQAPGEYTLLALDDASDLEYTNPEVLAPYLSRGTHVTLNADENTTVKLELIRRRSE